MAQDTSLQVIELQQLPIIVERLHSVKADIERRTAEATSLICTEETYKSVKDARAQLTKEFKEYEAQRTAIKSKILEPYNAFEQVYRECVTAPFQQADAELKQKITDVTSGIAVKVPITLDVPLFCIGALDGLNVLAERTEDFQSGWCFVEVGHIKEFDVGDPATFNGKLLDGAGILVKFHRHILRMPV